MTTLTALKLFSERQVRRLKCEGIEKLTNIFKFQFDLDIKCLLMSLWLGRLGDYSPHYDVKFDLPFTVYHLH